MEFLKILIILISIWCIEQLYMAIYTRFERSIADRKERSYQELKSEKQEPKQEKVSFIRRGYHWFERFSYGFMRYNLICVGKIPSYSLRRMLYRWVYCMDITKNTVIHGGCEFRSPWNIHADRCIISAGCILDGRSKIIIGQDVVLGSNVHVWTMEHSIDDPYFRVLANNALPVVIEAHAWVCSDATILPGCKIGEGVVVASRACVIKDCDDFFVYGGIPARKIRMRNRNLRYHTDSKPSWMFW